MAQKTRVFEERNGGAPDEREIVSEIEAKKMTAEGKEPSRRPVKENVPPSYIPDLEELFEAD